MNLQDCTKFANEYPICYLATMDGDQPRVRALSMVLADERGFGFCTLYPKQFSKQLHANPKIEICFYNNATEFPDMKMMRVTGKAEFTDEKVLMDKAIETRKGLSDVIGQPVESLLEIFRISTGEAYFWTIMDNLKEPDIERIRF
ncbi:pyridoxamine 5'-phosphate oxidase family protein [bacterium]|nr:pyridoxamine 5'-phosphate oxidase family protein [bacterium]